MSFTSISFIVFLPVVITLYFVLPNKARPVLLLIASYFFYAFADFKLVFLILFTTAFSYMMARSIEKNKSKGTRKLLFILYLVVALGTLFVFKYLNFAVNSVISIANLLGSSLDPFFINIILPVGISFYTFQTISYVTDIYLDKKECEPNFIIFALFVSYFPQLVAGPIEKSENLIPQFKEKHHFNSMDLRYGLQKMAIGYVKKIVVADCMAIFVNNVFGDVANSSGLSLLIATFMFGIQIYCDFSGYSDIAKGVSRIMGIKLMDNFDKPYYSSSLKEFWNRWHISLNDFFTEYVYIPLGGNKKGVFRKCLNIFVVFLLSGLWHGAALHFVVWGVIHGLLRIIEGLLSPHLSKISLNEKAKKVIGVVTTFLLVNIVWVFFRANTMSDALLVFSKIFTSFLNGSGMEYFTIETTMHIAFSIILLIVVEYLPTFETMVFEKKATSLLTVTYATLCIAVIIAWIFTVSTVGESSFIYFQF